ncbi:hypothetical protein, partial [Pectobacterium parmentieri]
MPEIIDQANELVELTIQHALANRHPPPVFTGKCRNCGETISAGNYCDKVKIVVKIMKRGRRIIMSDKSYSEL